MDHDDDDTDETLRRRPDLDSGVRAPLGRRTSPHGIPISRMDGRPSRSHQVVVDEPPAGDLEALFSIEQRLVILEGVRRGQRKLVAAALVAGLGSLGAVLVWAFGQRDATADERARIRYLEREVDRLGSFVYRSSLQSQPDYPPALRSSAPRMDPAPKDPLP